MADLPAPLLRASLLLLPPPLVPPPTLPPNLLATDAASAGVPRSRLRERRRGRAASSAFRSSGRALRRS